MSKNQVKSGRKLIGVISVMGGYLSSRMTVMSDFTGDFKTDCENLIADYERLIKRNSPNFKWTAYNLEKSENGTFAKHNVTLWTYQGSKHEAFDMVGTLEIIDTYYPE